MLTDPEVQKAKIDDHLNSQSVNNKIKKTTTENINH